MIAVEGGRDRRIRARRSGKPAIDAWRALDAVSERERGPGGEVEEGLTVFLAGSECPFTCVFCDLWRHTLDRPTPRGALPRQIERAIAELGRRPAWRWVKLYNASNFFDRRAVPVADHEAIARAVDGFERVVVECHPRLVGPACRQFAGRLTGLLEVAMGLETVHPEVLPRLNKRMTVEAFDRAADRLRTDGIGLRAFVLLGVPYLPADEQVHWTLESVAHALGRGASSVSIVPMRETPELARLAGTGRFEPPDLSQVEEALERALALGGGVVQVDPWDLERLGSGCGCEPARRARLVESSLAGRAAPPIRCSDCGDGRG